ncbi:hypothetical protein N7478_007735 [Penicillium angulare]|uniref:uncharacterized protein n=1 Tax=Penicillium angulare TaxID=116970 RepID=UPI002540E03C|nr:uncharacterized protein N7478_007735 [Penicillium angulare]KAJ5272610.1 hypothetical protein N7478_007735 [Penicillium angulare]
MSSLTVFRGFPDTGRYVWSPFVTKLEARLRFGNIAYKTEPGSMSNSPKGKLPYISIENEDKSTKLLSDSTLIIKELIQSKKLKYLNSKLSGSQRLQDIALQALLEDKLYFYGGYEKWIQNYYTMRDKILAALPWPVKVVVGNIIYNKNLRTLNGQGTGKFTDEEIAAFRIDLWDTLNAAISESHARHGDNEGPFWVWGGEEPTEADAVVYGFIAAGLVCESAPTTQCIIRGYPALLVYARRIHDVYFPDYELWE